MRREFWQLAFRLSSQSDLHAQELRIVTAQFFLFRFLQLSHLKFNLLAVRGDNEFVHVS